MRNVSEHFICIPLRFPCRPWLYRKLSQWLINCPGRSMREPGASNQGQSGCSQCLLRDGEHFSCEKQPCFGCSHTKQHADTYNMSTVSIESECCHDINNNQKIAHVHHTYVLHQKRQLISSMFVYSHPTTDQLQDSDKRSQTTFVDVKLLSFPYRPQTAPVTWHHREEEPSPPSVLTLIWTVTSCGPQPQLSL